MHLQLFEIFALHSLSELACRMVASKYLALARGGEVVALYPGLFAWEMGEGNSSKELILGYQNTSEAQSSPLLKFIM